MTFNGSQEHMEMNRRGIKIERVYECKDCDKAFTREEHLKRHAKSHTDEPVHRCEVLGCSKAYTRKERLTRHYKVSSSRNVNLYRYLMPFKPWRFLSRNCNPLNTFLML